MPTLKPFGHMSGLKPLASTATITAKLSVTKCAWRSHHELIKAKPNKDILRSAHTQ